MKPTVNLWQWKMCQSNNCFVNSLTYTLSLVSSRPQRHWTSLYFRSLYTRVPNEQKRIFFLFFVSPGKCVHVDTSSSFRHTTLPSFQRQSSKGFLHQRMAARARDRFCAHAQTQRQTQTRRAHFRTTGCCGASLEHTRIRACRRRHRTPRRFPKARTVVGRWFAAARWRFPSRAVLPLRDTAAVAFSPPSPQKAGQRRPGPIARTDCVDGPRGLAEEVVPCRRAVPPLVPLLDCERFLPTRHQTTDGTQHPIHNKALVIDFLRHLWEAVRGVHNGHRSWISVRLGPMRRETGPLLLQGMR